MVVHREVAEGFGIVVLNAGVNEGVNLRHDGVDLGCLERLFSPLAQVLEKSTTVGRVLVAEHGARGDVHDRGENVIAQLVVVVLEQCDRNAVVVGVNRVDGISGNSGRFGIDVGVAGECTTVKTKVRGFDGFTRDWVGRHVEWRRVFVVVCRSRHVSFELSGLTKAEDDDSAILVDDALRDESVKMRCTNGDRGLEFEDPAA